MPSPDARPALHPAARIYREGGDLVVLGGSEPIRINELTHELLLAMDGARTLDGLVDLAGERSTADRQTLAAKVRDLVDVLDARGYLWDGRPDKSSATMGRAP